MVGSTGKNNKWNVVGEELLALSWGKELMKIDSSIEADIYSYNKLPEEKLDLMVYMNYNTKVKEEHAEKRLLYIENDFGEGGKLDLIYKNFCDYKYDGILSYSHKACDYFSKLGYKTYYFPFSVDTDIYQPTEYDKDFDYDIAYVGSNIKGQNKNKDFFSIALKHKFGLFGNWSTMIPPLINPIKILKRGLPLDIYDIGTLINYFRLKPRHKFNITLREKSQGKISHEDMMKLLSSSKICFNLTLKGNQELDTISYRIMEAFSCKGFVISDFCPILKETFGDAIVTVKNKKELKKVVDYYLSHPEERKAKAEKGYEIIQKQFTSKQRAKELYDIIMEHV